VTVAASTTLQSGSWWSAVERSSLRISWPELDGVTTRVVEAGEADAPPLLLLHGTGGHCEAFIFNLAALAETHHVIAYDLPAHGWSSAPDRSYEIDGNVQHLRAVIDHFRLGRVSIVGQSLGGWIATRLCVLNPEQVDSLVLVGPGGTVMNPEVMGRIRSDSIAAVTDPTLESVRHRVELIVGEPRSATAELVECRLRIYSQPGAVERMEHTLCLQDPDVRRHNLLSDDDLRCVRQRTLIIAGDLDRVVPLPALERWSATMARAELFVMRGCGHWPQFERPGEFNARVLEFLGGEA
jgi:2-hydroxy-6-oxonona-2,4-dienedioate hydrolase